MVQPVPEDHAADKAVSVLALECGGLDFVAEIREGAAYLFLPDFSGLLPQTESASGVRYEAEGIRFWTQGESAMLDYRGKSYRNCVNNRRKANWETAKLGGVDFRGVGNEPPWILDIQGAELRLLTNYGDTRHTYMVDAKPQTNQQVGWTRYTATGRQGSIRVLLENKNCTDTMADTEYPSTVTVELENRVLTGCGRALH